MSDAKRLTYITGTRADFGLMLPILRELDASPLLDLELVVTGMHLSDRFGWTEREVEDSGLQVERRIPVPVEDDSGEAMGIAAGEVTVGMARYFAERRPDALILLGDRGEMLAAATAALFAKVPIVHIAGGERSGSVDESIRHAISKLAHLHLVAIEDGEQRLIGMGEDPARIFRVGAPGLAGLTALADQNDAALRRRYGFDPSRPFALVLFHPVVQDAAAVDAQWRAILAALAGESLQIVALMPNADHGSAAIRREIEAARRSAALTTVTHMPRRDYLSTLKRATLLIGNSSSGIVEAASLLTPVVDVGDRQQGRLRSANVFHAEAEPGAIRAAIARARNFDARGLVNVYGEPHADIRVRQVLETVDLSDPALLKKSMPY